MRLTFSKMHGAGNDFVLVDRRGDAAALPVDVIARLCDRHRGVGCDQLLTIEVPRQPGSTLGYRIWNADGSVARQCGNGARCVAAWAQRQGLVDGECLRMDSPAGTVEARFLDGAIEVNLGPPRFDDAALPFLDDQRPRELRLGQQVWPFATVSMGNPHAVLRVDGLDRLEVTAMAVTLQKDPRFADGCNVGFAEPQGRQHIRLRVVERGAGETLACGSGACAAVVTLMRQGELDSPVAVDLPGGRLHIAWAGDGEPVIMRGPAEFVFEATINL